MEQSYRDRFQEFLDSGTTGAKATKIALVLIAIASVPALTFIAAGMGNAVQVFKQFKTSQKLTPKQISDSLRYLRARHLIEYVGEKNGKTIVKITKRGEKKLRAFDIELMEIKKPKRWDGKWRFVIFDIPIRFNKGRDALRFHLIDLGFYQFQKSAWVYPYPCEDEIIFIADFFRVGKYVEVLTVENVLQEYKLKKYFDL